MSRPKKRKIPKEEKIDRAALRQSPLPFAGKGMGEEAEMKEAQR